MALPASALMVTTFVSAALFYEESINESHSFLSIVEQFIRERAGKKSERASIFTVRQRLKYWLANPFMRAGL
ncbi:hypothetical protein EMVG_00088 [Emiliania huxleyi virus PS401]|jgi:hypothetical protein|nr:hypothetical protein EMVG_00088 [Emiliania huxleyi virus PS401]